MVIILFFRKNSDRITAFVILKWYSLEDNKYSILT